MKRKMLLPLLMLLAAEASATSATEYLCFMKLQDGRDWLAGYGFEGATAPTQQELKKFVKDSGTFASDGVSVLPVANVVECVVAGEAFTNDRAQQLQKNFPR